MATLEERLTTALADRYRLERELGAGGMATVYLARDLRHNRPVALKVLKPELGAVLGVERFLSEIEVTANLQHPNLLPLFDSGEADGLLFYVMPYVEGETLRHRLDREKQLPVDEAIRIAVAIAGALDYAHAHNVVHRDLKPENILLQHGQPVLADFGIALAVANAGGTRITQTGLSLGTPKYMSPEQATGDRVIDGRTDIYSLAAVLYECLTGDAPHEGNTAQAIIARLLSEKPRSIRAARDRVPEYVEAAVERALAKLAADRFSTAREFAQALTGPPVGGYVTGQTSGFSGAAVAAPPEVRITFAISRARLRTGALWAAGAVAVALGLWGWVRPVAVPPQPRVSFAMEMSDSVRPREDIGGQNIAISRDGAMVVYVGGLGMTQLFLRRLDDREPRAIPGTAGATFPRFTPDGQWISFLVGSTLKRVPIAGGSPTMVAEEAGRYDWGDGDVIVTTRSGRAGLFLVGDDSGPLTVLDTALKETAHYWPEVLPGGKAILFTTERGGVATGRLAAMRLSDRKIIRYDVLGENPRYLSSGHVLLGRQDGTVVAVPFDAKSLEVTGRPATVLDMVVVKGGGATEVAVSANGTLVYVEGVARQQLIWVDRAGNVQPVLPATRRYAHPRLSPSGDRIAVAVGADATMSSETDVWIVDVATKQLTRLTNDGRSAQPEWTPDGKRIVWIFQSDSGNQVRVQAWDGSGRPETIPTPGHQFNSAVPVPAGNAFVSSQFTRPGATVEDIWSTPMSGGSESRVLVHTDVDEYMPRLSPDGRWLAYYGGVNPDYDVYVAPADGSGSPRQVSFGGGREPMWSPTGTSLFFRSGGRMLEARISAAPFQVTVDSLFNDPFRWDIEAPAYDVARDAGRFVMLRAGDERQRVIVTLGWFEVLRERLGQVRK